MSRAYEMRVEVTGFSVKQVEAIKNAAEQEWAFDKWREDEAELVSAAEGQLCGGEMEEEFADRLATAIWRANKGFCLVAISATCLDDLPYETHVRDEVDYERL